jgi:hypothetical protein
VHSLSHCATAPCNAAAETAYAFLADAAKLGTWALGSWATQPLNGGVVRGTSLFDASQVYVRADGDPERLSVDFAVGDDPGTLVRRIAARVVPGPTLGLDDRRCVVTLLAWRTADMSDERWHRLSASHDVEILLLRARIEEADAA